MPTASSRKANSVYGSVTQTIVMDCESSASVGNLVRQDQSIDNKAEVAIDHSKSYPIIGRISKKITATTCEVILRGVIDYTPIVPQGRVYLSSLGGISDVFSSPGYLQMLGYSFGNGKIHFEPNSVITKKL